MTAKNPPLSVWSRCRKRRKMSPLRDQRAVALICLVQFFSESSLMMCGLWQCHSYHFHVWILSSWGRERKGRNWWFNCSLHKAWHKLWVERSEPFVPVIILVLLLKEVCNARLEESDLQHLSQKTQAPTIPTYWEKEEENKTVEEKNGTSSLLK